MNYCSNFTKRRIGASLGALLLAIPAFASTYHYQIPFSGLRAPVVDAGAATPAPPVVPPPAPAPNPQLSGVTFRPVLGPPQSLSADKLTYSVTAAQNGGLWYSATATGGQSAGKWYWEFKQLTVGNRIMLGVSTATSIPTNATPYTNGISFYGIDAKAYTAAAITVTGLGATAAGDTISVLLDMDNHTISFKRNCGATWTSSTVLNSATYYPAVSAYNFYTDPGSPVKANFGASPFTCAVPSGYTAFST